MLWCEIDFLGKFDKIGFTSEKTIFSRFCEKKLQKWDKTKNLMLLQEDQGGPKFAKSVAFWLIFSKFSVTILILKGDAFEK